ncbi:hypothetical protein [Streptomyces acidiscabies]|nr:hypothetical protein [Streptomyces acidiscabies]
MGRAPGSWRGRHGHEAYSWGGGAKAHRGSVAWWVTEQQITDE